MVWLAATPAGSSAQSPDEQALRENFRKAWQAARRGDRAQLEQLSAGLQDYVLYPYLRYNDYLSRRKATEPAEVAGFLSAHRDWAFHDGLRRAWLRSLGETKRWDALIQYADTNIDSDTEVLCYLAEAKIQRKQTDGLTKQIQDLWAVGKSQPDACDLPFSWLRKQGGITPELAWLRISRAMRLRNSRLTLYLARYTGSEDAIWLDRWQQQDSSSYYRLDRSKSWPDEPRSREIVAFGLNQLARKDADRAWQLFSSLDDHFDWDEESRAGILREIALWSAVAGAPDTDARMRAVPTSYRNGQMLEWWARDGLARSNWAEVVLAIAEMDPELRNSERWQYWDATARIQLGDEPYARQLLENLAEQASYHGFLAADRLNLPYAICPLKPEVSESEMADFATRPGIRRSLELSQVDMKNWSRSEWSMATRSLAPEEMRLAAALATREGWFYEAIVVLAGGGELRWYDWRFPLAHSEEVRKHAEKRGLDNAWIMGLMRSESAMASDAISSAGARGLMQVTPGTARQIARRHSYTFSGGDQLLQAEDNILFGTTFLQELMAKFNNNPVLVSGAYNAGPGAVERWLQDLPGQDATIWIEVLPYFETRDYIPRVLAFATIYNYLLDQPLQRISNRMPPPDPAQTTLNTDPRIATVACPVQLSQAGD